MNTYKIYGRDPNMSADLAGFTTNRRYLRSYKAKDKESAIRKFYEWSKKKHFGWPLYSLTAQKERS